MRRNLLHFLCCPDCGAAYELEPATDDEDVEAGRLECANGHVRPIVDGIPRICPDAGAGRKASAGPRPWADLDRVRESFSREWGHHRLGDRTWYLDLPTRVREVFLDAVRIPSEELADMVVLDAGCGNGSQSAAYTAHVREVLAVDLSSGVDVALAYRDRLPPDRAARLHVVQADVGRPPIRPQSVDIIHSMGVLHHTPDTYATFRALVPLLRPGGTLYLWLYKYDPVVTPLLAGLRAVTTRIPPRFFDRLARLMAPPFVLFTRITTWTRVRPYQKVRRREAALALIDIFGAPFAHYHSIDEVTGWLRAAGFTESWLPHQSRRGFGICARLGPARAETARAAAG
jgi:SAM-dependent methyltransferase/uncharacterized protein YbaR (Trm112 family)